MYLKSIEVQGFKSFANKIVFEFHNGITGIVGPNGSGKSNVADAVRWVLGEQSAKQLRGAKMEDIIFSGTENRKPLGFANVALTIDNSDHQLAIAYETVTVSRRVYRSGESEYQINGTSCRLKDVNELFYDTGIGKEGYSIIGQGQVERILSGKPEERRELFDEAAGIVKFKRRKTEALKRLEAEQQNLTRVQDILSELEKQVGPLEKQAETAKEYLRLKEELKLEDINVFLLEKENLKKQISELEEKRKTVAEDLKGSREKQEQIRTEYEKTEQELKENRQKEETCKAAVSDTQIKMEKAESEIRLLKEQIRSIQNQDKNTALRIEAIQNELKEREQEKEKYIREKAEADGLLSVAQEKQKKAEETLSYLSQQLQILSKQAEEDRDRMMWLLNEKGTVKTKVQRYETMLEQTQLRKAELSSRVLEFKSNEALQDETIALYAKQLKKRKEAIAKLEEENKYYEQEIEKLQLQETELEKKKNEWQQQFHMVYSCLESLKNLTERYEGYGNSIRKIMGLKNTRKGIIGVVADIIQTERKYETAIETALGGSIQNIVTDKENTAKELIAYLKRNQFGRATFLPLDGIKDRNSFFNEKVLKEPGVVGLASTLVTVEPLYQDVVKNLLGRIIVVDQIDHALLLARKYQYTLRIVTLEGELLSIGGSMTGGAFKNSSNLLSRRREMEELEKKKTAIEQELERINQTKNELICENKKNREKLEQNKHLLQEHYIKQNTEKLNLEHAKEEKASKAEEYQTYIRENKAIEQQVSEIRQNLKELKEQLSWKEQENIKLEKELQNLSVKIEKFRKEEEEKKQFAETLRMDYSFGQQKTAFASENLDRIMREMGKLKEEQNSLAEYKNHAAQEMKEKGTQILKIEQQIKEAELQVEKKKKEKEKLKEEQEKLEERNRLKLRVKDELAERILLLDKESFRLNSQKEKLEETLAGSINYLWDEYELTQTEAAKFYQESHLGFIERKRNINSLKTQIRDLGSVNVNAIEEFKEISKRYLFLKGQHQDLVDSKQTLLKIIEELDTGMRTQFLEKFEEIKVEFNKVFQELFGGGKGMLSLVEDEDILEAGIQIISQPPGKKLQNMMQLSGGEKALTAIALLFAIQNLKPSPFCLLDEIEAALDDSNVGRYADYLHKLTAHTQFIVITHRRGTMAAADRLYGITMQEKGVSTLISVDLIEDKLEGTERKINRGGF